MESIIQESTWKRPFCVGDDAEIQEFAERIGDTNPLHHDDGAARKAGLPGIIAPGVMIIGFVSALIAENIPGIMVLKMEMEFQKPVCAGTVILVSCSILQKKRFARGVITITNHGDVVAKGSCTLLLPPP